MRIAVLSSAESWYFRDLCRAAGGRHTLEPLAFSQLVSTLNVAAAFSAESKGQRLTEFDAVLVRTMPPGSLEQVVFRMDVLGELERRGVVVFNPPRALEVAVDKYLASARLQAAGLCTPRTWICQTAEDAMTGFAALGGDVVLKPLFGGEGRGLTRLNDESLALRAFTMLSQLGAVLYLQEFIPHEGCDLRLMVLGDRVLGIRRCNPHDWRTNISRGAVGGPWERDEQLVELARRAAAAVGAPWAGVDILPARDGRHYVLEVNAVPGWKGLGRTLQVDVAALALDYLESVVSRAQAR
jgi:ribosomal protein S6--L-glutamate ligase